MLAFLPGFGQCHLLASAPQRLYQAYSAPVGSQKHRARLEEPWLLSHNWKISAGGMLTTKPLTTELLLLILSIPAVADSVTDPAGRDTSHSVVTQEACPVIRGCAEAVH